MRGLFVVGTDTDVGKTVVSALLCEGLANLGSVSYFKPVQAGAPFDRDKVASLVGPNVFIHPNTYCLDAPMSPNRAAQKQGVEIKVENILEDINCFDDKFHVFEAAGGLLVPLNAKDRIVDLVKHTQLPSVLVASTKLGTINHTLLSLETLKNNGIPCLGIILVGEEDSGLRETLEEQMEVPVLFELPHIDSLSRAALQSFIEESDEARGFFDSCFSNQESDDENESLESLDKKYVWHPFTQHGIVKRHPVVHRGQGSYLWHDDKKVIDAISSWWVNLFGHCHPKLSAAVKSQVDILEHVLFAGFSHEPAIRLSQKLVSLAGSAHCYLKKVFFSDNGSTAVEVALKMAFQYFQQKGDVKKNRFLALTGSYHGDTLGAMSVGERKGFNTVFNPLMFDVDFVDPFDLSALNKAFAEKGDQYAGVIVEPMVQGASGMRMYPVEFLNRLAELKQEYGTLVICDEIFTGFYRTGKLFAFEHSQLRPDLLCLSKGLTGGFLPLSATLSSQALFDCFENESMKKAFLHGHSYTANPIACRVALATMELLTDSQTEKQIHLIEKWTGEELEKLSTNKKIKNIRQLGTIAAMEVLDDDPHYFKGDFSYRFNQECIRRGVLLRPLGGTVYTVPPYCINQNEIEKVFCTIDEVVNLEF